MLVIAFNGAPSAGKDTAGELLNKLYTNSKRFKFAGPVKRGTHAAFGLMVPEDHFEYRKNDPCEEFFGRTPRSCYIEFSENYMKPLYGKDIFGKLLLRQLRVHDKKHGPKVAIITDCGFREELDVIGEEYTTILVRMHREGYDFRKDSRSLLEWENVFDIINDGSIRDLEIKIEAAILPLLP